MDALFLLPLRPMLKAVNGDREGAVKDLTRVAGVVAGGIAGFMVAGPLGAYAGGVTGGVAADGIITGVDTERKGVFSPSGTIKNFHSIVSGESGNIVEDIVDLGQVLVADGLMGNSYGGLVGDKLKISGYPAKKGGKITKGRFNPYDSVTHDKLKAKETLSINGKCKSPRKSLDQYLELVGNKTENICSKPPDLPIRQVTTLKGDNPRVARM